MARVVAVTGAAGFLGQSLVATLADRDDVAAVLALDTERALDGADFGGSPKVHKHAFDVRNRAAIASIFRSYGVGAVLHLAGIMSAQSEANLELGLLVNVEGTVNMLLEAAALSAVAPAPIRFVFASSVAACVSATQGVDGPLDSPVRLVASSSYGTHKGIGEMLVSDLSRRGAVDGLTVRLPTVTVRAGMPSGAASSFVSDIIREPLHGRNAVCPVDPATRVCVCSPATAVAALIRALEVDTSRLGRERLVIVPGLTVSVQQMLDATRSYADVDALVSHVPSEVVAAIVQSWPAELDSPLSRALGFTTDHDIDSIIDQYRRGHLAPKT